MKNLKRVLSLALTGVMLVGMMAIGASAANKDFTDQDEIVHTEAVSVMSTLGVLQGKDTGAYDPKATVTRGEMAKIICVMLNGGNDPTLGTSGANMFSDTANHWAKSYIEYCASMGIIAGMGDGTFGPDLPVTGAAAAKMLLVALGYDSDISGFTGPDWEINVNRIANTEAKLYEEIKSIDTSAGLSRDDTAQMAYNTLEARIMERTDNKVVSSGEISYSYEQSKTTTFLNKYFDALTFIGQMDGNADTHSLTDGYIQVSGDLDTADTSGEDYKAKKATFPADFDIANIGEEVKVIFKDGKGGQANRPDKNDTIYGVFNTGATEVINVTKNDVKKLEAAEQRIKLGDDKYDVADEVKVITNYNMSAVKVYNKAGTGKDIAGGIIGATGDGNSSDLTKALMGTTGDTIKFVCDEEGDINRAYVVESKIAVVTSKSSSKITMNNTVGTIELKDNEVADDVAKDDVVVVTTLYAADADDEGAYSIVTKAEKVSGEVTRFKDKETVTAGGEVYKIYGKTDMYKAGNSDAIAAFDDDSIGEDFDLYLVNGFVAYAVKTSESASNYSVVLEASNGKAGDTFDALKLRVMAADGTKTNITVSDDSEKKTKADYPVGSIVTYTMNKDGEADVTIEAAYKDLDAVAAASYNKNTKSFDGIVTDGSCVLFATTASAMGDIKAYNIRDLGNVNADAKKWVAVTNKAGDRVLAVFADLGEAPSGATSTTVYGIVSAYNGTVKIDNTNYKQYVVDVNDTKYTLNVPRATTAEQLDTGMLVSFDPTSDDIYSAATVAKMPLAESTTVILGYVDEYNDKDGIISIYTAVKGFKADGTEAGESDTVAYYEGTGKVQTFHVEDDVKLYFVNADDEVGVESGSVAPFDTTTGYANVILVLDNASEKNVTSMMVEVGGDKGLSLGTAPCEHANGTATPAKAATCTEDGTEGYWTCDDCGKVFTDSTHATETTVAARKTNATGHTPGTWDTATDVEGVTDGEHYQACTKCNAVIAHHEAPTEAAGKVTGCTVCDGLSL